MSRTADGIKVPAGDLLLQVAAGTLRIDIGNTHLHQHRFILSGAIIHESPYAGTRLGRFPGKD